MQDTKKVLSVRESVDQLAQKFPQAVLKTEMVDSETVSVNIIPSAIQGVCKEIYDQGARFVSSAATDQIRKNNTLDLSHFFYFDEERLTCIVKTQIDAAAPSIQSISSIIPGANWAERECQDLLGIEFIDHPDSRRLILADDWPKGVHPLRKDFAYDYRPPSAPENAVPLKTPGPSASVVPIGPFYPVLEEPAYFRVFVEGEKITGCDYRGFHNHRGIEKLGDSSLTYNEVCFLAERI
jgi:Ni,Fe-hydrogenase III component G